MVFTEKELARIAKNAELSELEESERVISRTFLEPVCGKQASGLTEDSAWFPTQATLDYLEARNRR